MKEERDLRGFALSFTAGVAVSAYSKEIIGFQPTFLASLFHTICIAILISLAILYNKKRFTNTFPLLILIEGFICGISVGIGGIISDISNTQGIINTFPSLYKCRLIEEIDSIAFERQDTGSLVKALLAGDKSNLSEEMKKVFRDSGAAHILALSGMHLGIIYSVIAGFLKPLGRSRIATIFKSSLLVTICGIYTMITGAAPSLTRAFIFILLRETARLASRSMDLKNILCTSIIIHLTISPTAICNLGFQLSYAAMIGIAYIYPFISNFWPPEKEGQEPFHLLHKIWEISALSLSCQLTAGIAAWIYFDSFPIYFLITNLIALPLSGIIIPLALFTLIANYCGIDCLFLQTITEKTAGLLIFSLSTISSLTDNS